jgi:hypothetical protein
MDQNTPQAPLPPTQPVNPRQSSELSRWLPRLIIIAVLVNVFPVFIDPHYRNDAELAKYAANIVFVIFFFVLVIREVFHRNAKD